MYSFHRSLIVLFVALFAEASAADNDTYYGYGKAATVEEIAGWDIDVRPDGAGLPPGEGSVEDGEYLYEGKCAECHGSFGEGNNQFPALAGGEGTLTDKRPHRTVGSYWPHTSTLWDYINRAMPYTQPESLSDTEVYAITAYVLFLNDLVDDDFVLSRENFTSVDLPNKPNFVPDSRPDTFNIRCMKDCKERGSIRVVTSVERQPVQVAVVQAASPSVPVGEAVYRQACGLCHDNGVTGAPKPHNDRDWSGRVDQGMDVLVRHAIEGFQGETGVMLPKGGFSHLSDEEVAAAVSYMVGASL
jgi:S-disulfanyl-L-cysteine oxidoreductase SoxD